MVWTYARQNALKIQPPIWENQGLRLLKFLFSVFCSQKQKDYQIIQTKNTPKNTKAVFTFVSHALFQIKNKKKKQPPKHTNKHNHEFC